MTEHEATAPRVAWHVSSHSVNGSGQCVEAGPLLDGTRRRAVRDSIRPDAGAFVVTAESWSAFVGHIR